MASRAVFYAEGNSPNYRLRTRVTNVNPEEEKEKEMRSGPATRTAFACVNSPLPWSRRSPALPGRCMATPVQCRSQPRGASALESAALLIALRRAVPLCETVFWGGRNARVPTTLARFGNRPAVHPRKLPQSQPCAITSSVAFTPAV